MPAPRPQALLAPLLALAACGASPTTLTVPPELVTRAAGLTRVSGYGELSRAPVARPTVARVRAGLPRLLVAVRAASREAARSQSLAAFAATVPADSRMALLLAAFLSHDQLGGDSGGEIASLRPGTLLGELLPELEVVGVRDSTAHEYGVEVFVSLAPEAAPARDVRLLDRRTSPALLVAEQGGHLVLVSISPALLRAVQELYLRQLE